MTHRRNWVGVLVPLTTALSLSAAHAAGLQAMDGLGVAESLLSPAGAPSAWMLMLALGFVVARLVAILAVPGLLLVAAVHGVGIMVPGGGTDRRIRPAPETRP